MNRNTFTQSGEWAIISRRRGFITYIKSLKFRIFLVVLLAGWIPMMIVSGGVLDSYRERAITVRGTDVQNQCRILSNQLLSYNYLKDPSSELIGGELTQLSNLYDGRFIVIDENFKVIRDTYGLIEGKLVVSEEVIRCFKGETINQLSNKRYIEMTIPIQETESQRILGVLLVSVSTDSIWDNYEVLAGNARIFILICGVIILTCGLLLAYFLVRPFNRMIGSLQEISEGHSTEDLKVRTYTETERISEEFNKIVNQMRVLDESRQEFVSNVSHELKTPLTSMKVLADSLLAQEEAPVELYKEFMGDIAEEIERENKIITALLSLVKMDKKAANLNIEPVDINDLLELILKRVRPIASKKNIEMVLESFRPVTAEVDAGRLTLAFINLIENAVKYNKENGWVHVSLDADHKFFYVKVMDSGMGIPEESLDYVFERFYRVDKSHSNEIDGTGLGLAITKSAILVHKGAIKVSSHVGEGTTFSVRIPLNYIA